MRHQYTPIFKNVLTSRVWALSPAARAVWLWLTLTADEEGCVWADVTGVAVGARVTGPEAREALELLGLDDADADPEDPFQGRIIERMLGGWRVLGTEGQRGLVRREEQREARRARNRGYMQRSRDAANDVTTEDHSRDTEGHPQLTEGHETDRDTCPSVAPEGDTEPVSESSEDSSLTRARSGSGSGSGSDLNTPTTTRLSDAREVIHSIPPDWVPSESLRQDALMAGVERFDEQLVSLRLGPIGGVRGVFAENLDGYIRKLFGSWRTWEESQRAKAAAASAANAKPRGQTYRATESELTTTSAATAFRPSLDAEKFCKKHNLDLAHAVKLYRQSPEHEQVGCVESERRFEMRLRCWRATGTFIAEGPLPRAVRLVGAPS